MQQASSSSMPPPPPYTSWRSIASGASSRVREYLRSGPRPQLQITPATVDEQPAKQSWDQWARQKVFRSRSSDDMNAATGTEQVLLFPGWATRRFATSQPVATNDSVEQFTVDVAISGFATTMRPPELASRSQRAFIHLARTWAALPKIGSSTSPLLKPLDSKQMTEALDLGKPLISPNKCDDTFPGLAAMTEEPEDLTDSSASSRSGSPEPDLPTPSDESTSTSSMSLSPEEIAILHANFNARLRPFWASPIGNRIVRLRLYAHPRVNDDEPLMTKDIITTSQGFFNAQMAIPFELLCTHPRGVHIAYGERASSHHVVVNAQLLPNPTRPPPVSNPMEKALPATPPAYVAAEHTIPLSEAQIRVISDIDDTVKTSDIVMGARAAFRRVFTLPLEQVVIPNMASWYRTLHDRGVRFHYVSNAPFELLSLLTEFFVVSGLPPGSLRLKFYGGRSLFNGLWEAAAERKRAGVVEVLDSFPHSQFILIGDSGEQDLELYSSLARERPTQILAVFIRDVSTPPGPPLSDPQAAPRPVQTLSSPTNAAALHSFYSTSDLGGVTAQTQMAPSPPMSVGRLLLRAPRRSMSDPVAPKLASEPPSPGSSPPAQRFPGQLSPSVTLSPQEKRRLDLQLRMERAREIIPPHIPLRAFREPSECVEATQILNRLEQERKL